MRKSSANTHCFTTMSKDSHSIRRQNNHIMPQPIASILKICLKAFQVCNAFNQCEWNCHRTHILWLLIYFFVFKIFEFRSVGNHFFLKIWRTQLIHIQHERKFHILGSKQQKETVHNFILYVEAFSLSHQTQLNVTQCIVTTSSAEACTAMYILPSLNSPLQPILVAQLAM